MGEVALLHHDEDVVGQSGFGHDHGVFASLMRDAERADRGVVEGGARTALELFLSAGGDFRHLDHLLGLEGAAGHQVHGLAGVAERHFRIVHRADSDGTSCGPMARL